MKSSCPYWTGNYNIKGNKMQITTTQFEVINAETVKYSNPTDLAVKTQEEKIVLGKALDKEARLILDGTMTARILDIASEARSQRGDDFAREYLSKSKGLVSDASGKIEREINLLAAPAPVIEVEDDARVEELKAELEKQKAEAAKLYEDKLAKEAVLANDLKRAQEVIAKLQEGEDVTKALNEAAKLREQLEEAKAIAGKVPTLRSELDAKAEALAGAKTIANNLKREIAEKQAEIREAEAKLNKNTGEALLDYETKQNAKALAAIEVAKQIRETYTLQSFLLQNGMTEDEIKIATSSPDRTLYDTNDVEKIASIIYSERGSVSDTVIVDKIEGLIAGALAEVARADNLHTYETLKNQYHMEIRAMTKDALGE